MEKAQSIFHFFKSLEVSTPRLSEIILNTRDGVAIELPEGYRVYFIYNSNIETNATSPKIPLHCGIYKSITQALIGLYNQYKLINEQLISSIIRGLFIQPADEDMDNFSDLDISQKYELMEEIIDLNLESEEGPLLIFSKLLPITDTYQLATEVTTSTRGGKRAPFQIPILPNVNIQLSQYLQSLKVNEENIERQLSTEAEDNEEELRPPTGYNLYFLYEKRPDQSAGNLLYCNLGKSEADAIIGMYAQYKIFNENYANMLIANLLTTESSHSRFRDSDLPEMLVNVITFNYQMGKAPFYVKYFTLPPPKVKPSQKTARRSKYNDFMK